MVEHSRHCECCPGIPERLAELEAAFGSEDEACFWAPRSGHPEDVPTDRAILHAIHLDVHRILAALNALSRAGQHQVDATRKLAKAIETELETRPGKEEERG